MRLLGRHTERDESTPICAEGGAICTATLLDIIQHTGYAFTAIHQSDVGNGNAASLFFTVASSAAAPGHVHFGYEVVCEGEAEVAFYENPTMTANTGNAFTPICLNRANPQVSAWGSSSIYKDATINVSPATLLDIEVIGSKRSSGGIAVPIMHWSLGRGKSYCIKVANQSGAANETTIRILWGRHVEVD